MKTNTPEISVIIPAYNQAHYLADAIKSALGQSYRNISCPLGTEVIVVDDGSTDETAEVAGQFGEAICYVWQENQGLAGARNRGIREARGKYVALLDSDDEWQPDFLQKMISLAHDYPEAALYYSAAQCMDANGNNLSQRLGTGLIAPNDSHRMYWTLLRANFLIPSTILIRRRVIIEAGSFNAGFEGLEDWECWLRLLSMGHTFAGTAESLVRYRLHGKSLSTNVKKMQSSAIALAHKHFGVDDEQWQGWSKEKRRFYGAVYRYHALTSILYQNNWRLCGLYLRKMLHIDPSFAQDLDLFYEFALGNQPLGYRGTPHQLTLEENARQLLKILDDLFERPVAATLAPLRRQTYTTAYYALGLLAYHTEQTSLSRRFLRRALTFRPLLVKNNEFIKTLSKAHLAPPLKNWLKRLPKRQADYDLGLS